MSLKTREDEQSIELGNVVDWIPGNNKPVKEMRKQVKVSGPFRVWGIGIDQDGSTIVYLAKLPNHNGFLNTWDSKLLRCDRNNTWTAESHIPNGVMDNYVAPAPVRASFFRKIATPE